MGYPHLFYQAQGHCSSSGLEYRQGMFVDENASGCVDYDSF